MPAFQAINLEPEENIDEEVDNTKELQVDEALKRFQTALKLHAQGPSFFDEASEAYDHLFESEIFKYPEAATEYSRAERQPGDLSSDTPFPPVLDLVAADVDSAASSVPQALYLAYKNHGQFVLDRIRHRARISGLSRDEFYSREDVVQDARRALDDFLTALDRDPSDAELWRRTARLSSFLKSARIGRYCLEAAIELDDDPAVDEVDPPSLAESLAGEQLKNHLDMLQDEGSLSHPIMAPWMQKSLPLLLKRQLDPLPYLPDYSKQLTVPKARESDRGPARLVIQIPSLSWAVLGLTIVSFMKQHGVGADAVIVDIPGRLADEPDKVASPSEDAEVEAARAEQMQLEQQLASEAARAELHQEQRGAKDDRDTDQPQAAEEPPKERSMSLPSRKRSQSAAGLPETVEDENAGEKRSKRIRRRETQQEEMTDPSTLHATQLQQYQAADQYLFQMIKNILENLGVTDKPTVDSINEILDSCAADDRASKISLTAATDLRHAITSFSDENAKVLLNKKEQPALSLSSFLEHAKTGSQRLVPVPSFDEGSGLRSFVKRTKTNWMTTHDLVVDWLKAICPSYMTSKWSETMKLAVVQVVKSCDEDIYHRLRQEVDEALSAGERDEDIRALHGLVQMLFELHLDVYERITNPSSIVEYSIRVETKCWLGRWLDLASELCRAAEEKEDPLSLRFVWGAIFSTTLTDNTSREHILQCWTQLREYLARIQAPQIELPNNAVVPEISAAAADREISKLTTMDFFLSLFQDDLSDPVTVIENLEPVLNPASVAVRYTGSQAPPKAPSQQLVKGVPITDHATQGLRDLWKFLAGSSTELRLFLWSRLGDAYGKIKYATKQFSCHLKSIEMIVADFSASSYLKHPQDARIPLFFRMLRSLDDQLIHALSLALNEGSAFDILDEDHLRSTASALARLNSLLHVSAIFEDGVRIGMTPAPSSGATFQSFLNRLREIQVRAWCLQYTILKVGIAGNPLAFPTAETDLASFLSATHQVLGLRKCCKASNKIFLKMMRVELLKMKKLDNWEDYLGQVLYDLHGLKLGVGIEEVQDHGCPPEKLEKKNAVQLVERVTALAKGIPMKDLLKSDLKTTIEQMQQAIGQTKSTAQMMYNFKNFTEYLKRPIHPLHLYQAFRGEIALDAVSVNTSDNSLAKHGWFFLLGMIALTKFKGVDLNRRQTPGATDDLRIAATFIRLQLQFTPENWEAWFRLAECFDYELDEAVLWTADKINKERADLVKLQRSSIHCYTLALSSSINATVESDESDPLCELFHNFAMRLYASSREPFAMEPFHHPDQERFFIESMGTGTYRRKVHGEMTDYKVWKYAARLFRKAMDRNPKDWKNPFMLVKCMWKMYRQPSEKLDDKDKTTKPQLANLVKALEHAIHVVMAVKVSRNSDPILEPHYKIVSIVHKLVMGRELPPAEGAAVISRQPFGVPQDEDDPVEDLDGWEEYVIKNIRALKDKDKSNWQHRIIMRHARILWDEHGSIENVVPAMAAIGVLRESMFTKTMVMNVWKCDAERAGRHHVYTTQYVQYMVRLLLVTKDRTNLELLLRRLRKRAADFYHFSDLWQTCCSQYLRLLRSAYSVRLTVDDEFKFVGQDEFEILSDRITEWAGSTPANHAAFNCMREAIELKKLNGGQMRVAAIDDLIHDSYAILYFDIAKGLPGPDVATIIEERAALREREAAPPDLHAESKALNPLSSILNPPSGAATPQSTGEPAADKPGPLAAAESAPRRKLGVKRVEVIKKAEQAVTRAAEAPKSAGGMGALGKSRLGSLSSGKNGGNTPNRGDDEGSEAGDADEDAEMKDEEAAGDEDEHHDHGDVDQEQDGEHDGETRRGREDSSQPGSVHDSADDESELSDLSDVPEGYDLDPPEGMIFSSGTGDGDELESGEDDGNGDENGSNADDGDEAEEEEEDGAEGEEGDEEGDEDGDDDDDQDGGQDTEVLPNGDESDGRGTSS